MAKTIKIEVGDVFAVPLPRGGYGVGRLVHLSERWRLAEFFALRLESPSCPDLIPEIDRAMPVHNVVTLRIEEGAWPMLARGVIDDLPALDSMVFYRGLPAKRTYVKLNGEGVPECPQGECSSTMPQFAEYVAEQLDERLGK